MKSPNQCPGCGKTQTFTEPGMRKRDDWEKVYVCTRDNCEVNAYVVTFEAKSKKIVDTR